MKKIFDLSKQTHRNVHRKYHVYSDSDLDSKFNAGLAPLILKVLCMGRHHKIFLSATGKIVLLDHLNDEEERMSAGGLISAFGSNISTMEGNASLLDENGKCRCENIRDEFNRVMESDVENAKIRFSKTFPRKAREYCKMRKITLRKRRRPSSPSSLTFLHRDPILTSVGRFEKKSISRKEYLDELHSRCRQHNREKGKAYKKILQDELLKQVGGVDFNYSRVLRGTFSENFWRGGGAGTGHLYRDGFFYSVNEHGKRILVVAQHKTEDPDVRRVLFFCTSFPAGHDTVRLGIARRKNIVVIDSISFPMLGSYISSHRVSQTYNGMRRANRNMERALRKRFFQNGEERTVLGWEITPVAGDSK